MRRRAPTGPPRGQRRLARGRSAPCRRLCRPRPGIAPTGLGHGERHPRSHGARNGGGLGPATAGWQLGRLALCGLRTRARSAVSASTGSRRSAAAKAFLATNEWSAAIERSTDPKLKPLAGVKLRELSIDRVAAWSQANERALAPPRP